MFEDPWLLGLLVIVPMLAWRVRRGRRCLGIAFSSAASGWTVRPTWRQRLSWLPTGLTLLAMVLIIVALARPRFADGKMIVQTEGIAIEMVIDRSSSMQALDFFIDGSRVDRFRAVKHVAERFLVGDDAMQSTEDFSDSPVRLLGRTNDIVGLITFARYADAIGAPTLDHDELVTRMRRTRIVQTSSEDGTAIGDAIALAVEKLHSLDERRSEKIAEKVIVLLTDGENTAGDLDPLEGADLAKAMGIRIYTIGVGTHGLAPFPVRRSRTGQLFVRNIPVRIDEVTLSEIARRTGGVYFRATDTESLASIYERIDALEKTELDTQPYIDYRELAVQPWQYRGFDMPPLIWIAIGVLSLATVLANTWLRRFGTITC